MTSTPILLSIAISIIGLLYVVIIARNVLAHDEGTDAMKKISAAIRSGAQAFLRQEYRTLAVFAVVVAVAIAVLINWQTAVCFLIGAFTSALTGFIGMSIATRANSRTTAAAMESLDAGLRLAFRSGSVMGMSVVSIGLLGLSLLFFIFGMNELAVNAITGFSFGASSIALFARVGGGIYTKAADVGADLVGKVEAGIPEDDPRNPAVIADNVGDNVGDVAGMGADLYESYVGSIVAASAIAIVGAARNELSPTAVALPFAIAAVGIIAALIGSFLVRTKENTSRKTCSRHCAWRRGLLRFWSCRSPPSSLRWMGPSAGASSAQSWSACWPACSSPISPSTTPATPRSRRRASPNPPIRAWRR
jgi:K(+)-stimulated pyrophosphate-energized sodium pump